MSGPRVVMIVQARVASTRLPGKTLLPLAGEPLLARLLERVERCRALDEVVVATTDRAEDDAVAELARARGLAVFRGSEADVLGRYAAAAESHRAEVIVRLPADNPVPEAAEIDRIVRYQLDGEPAFASNLSPILGNGYPDGIGAETIARWALEEVASRERAPERREHPHLNFFDYRADRAVDPERYPVGTVRCPPEFARPDLRLDVDTPQDYAFMSALYADLYPADPRFTIRDILRWYDARGAR
ncbi:MAG: NTP transferase domain-containing protein [Solirubrobacterales bacterium]|nr:NTP transferase domain-containing protein [Solirubrobacterales bacterium]